MTAKKLDFPVWLQGTPEQQVAERQRQDLLRASFTRAKMTESERLIGRGALLEATARGNLEVSAGRNKEARILAENQLADALAMQGQFALAAETHNDKHRRKYFRDIVKAIEKPDTEKCDCPDSKATMNDVELAVTPRFEREKIFSPLHGDLVSVIECQKCGHRNARPPRSRLLPMQAALSQAEAARRPVQNDAQVLSR
jgi:hypothetical protein